MNIKIFSDGAHLKEIFDANENSEIHGMTTNPTLMAKAGVTDYLEFCREALTIVKEKPFSLEVFADEPAEMITQARLLSELGPNVYVKIPVVNTKGQATSDVIKSLSFEGVKLNVTAVFTFNQIVNTVTNLNPDCPAFISIFAGRIADAGVDPEPYVRFCAEIKFPKHEIIWASPREVFNVVQANRSGAEIITATPDLISKINRFGKDLHEFSIETATMFYNDAVSSSFKL